MYINRTLSSVTETNDVQNRKNQGSGLFNIIGFREGLLNSKETNIVSEML